MAKKASLTVLQRRFITAVAQDSELAGRFYLTGGTALAGYYLHHRRSDDLDFFAQSAVDGRWIIGKLNELAAALGLPIPQYEKLHDRNIFVFNVDRQTFKVEFSAYPFKQFNKPVWRDGIQVDNIQDIAANKLFAAVDRHEPKDLVDLAAIMLYKRWSPDSLVKLVKRKFLVEFERLTLADLLKRGSELDFEPKALSRPTLVQIRAFYRNQLAATRKHILVG
ncbi:MAG: nucleotidyl transferase AbiEii/AbiGii toxin family protein [Patescibacteria group bacterium]